VTGPSGAVLWAGLSKAQRSVLAELGWGLFYGVGFGLGIGFVFYNFQRQLNSEPAQNT
jgi:hypothetical protein